MTRFLAVFAFAFIVCFDARIIIADTKINGPVFSGGGIIGEGGTIYNGTTRIAGPINIDRHGTGVINIGDDDTGKVNLTEKIIDCDNSCDVYNDAYSFYKKGGPENERQARMLCENIIKLGGKALPYALALREELRPH